VSQISNFLKGVTKYKAVKYKIAVTTTNFFKHSDDDYYLVKAADGTFIASSTNSDPSAVFTSIVNNITPSATSYWEQGLESMMQALTKHGNQLFDADTTTLAIINVSDSDDASCKDECWGAEPENNDHWIPFEVTRYEDYLSKVKAKRNIDVEFFGVIGSRLSSACQPESYGDRYVDVQKYIGGLSMSLSICASEVQSSFTSIATTIGDRANRFYLTAKASGKKGFSTYVNTALIDSSLYTYDDSTNSVVFVGDAPKKGDKIEIRYTQQTQE
jgi:hypothetical protein